MSLLALFCAVVAIILFLIDFFNLAPRVLTPLGLAFISAALLIWHIGTVTAT